MEQHQYKISLHEPFDFESYDDIKVKINKALKNGKTEIVIDLNDVEHMDSSAIGMLIIAYKNSENSGAKVRVINANEYIHEMLYLTQLDKLFPIEKRIIK